MDTELALFRDALEAIAPITLREWEEIRPHLRPCRFLRDAYLQRGGEPAASIFFVAQGLVREYYVLPDGKERIKAFVHAGRFAAAYADGIVGRASQSWIQALQETCGVAVPMRTFLRLRDQSPGWERINRRVLEALYVRKEQREFQFLTMTATERYRLLLQDVPRIEEAVSQYHLASYLGITPVALSRIRRRLREAQYKPAR